VQELTIVNNIQLALLYTKPYLLIKLLQSTVLINLFLLTLLSYHIIPLSYNYEYNSTSSFQLLSYCNEFGGVLFHDGTLLHSKCQYTTVKHSRQLLEHTYTSDPRGLETLTPTPIEFFQRDLLWESSITHSSSCSQKASKHTSGQFIVGLSVRLHATTALRRIVHH
jgi:hypothetical protein